MKVRSVSINRRRKLFEITTSRRTEVYPFDKLDPAPTTRDAVVDCAVDRELASEAFTYWLHSGRTGTVHLDQVFELNEDPSYKRDRLLYGLTVEARRCAAAADISKRELARRLETSQTQIYRLLDRANMRKSVDQMIRLLSVLDCDVELTVKKRSA